MVAPAPPVGGRGGSRALAPSLPFAGAVAGASCLALLLALLWVALVNTPGYGYVSGTVGGIVLVVGLLAAAGLVAALVIAILAVRSRRSRATSLRTRSFFVIAACILIPSLCLSALGVFAYYRNWNNAAYVYSNQATYRATELNQEISSLGRTPMHLTPAERAHLSRAIVQQFSVRGHSAGALLGDYRALVDPDNHALPRWAAHTLRRKGYVIGAWSGPGANPAHIVAWRVGAGHVYYYTDYWGDLQRVWPQPPLGRLAVIGAYGIALVAVIGVLGAWILSRSVVRPVRRLAEASHRIADAGSAAEPVKPEGPRELRELATSFNDMNTKLTKAQETEQAFLLSVSHELKTPLTSIRGYAEGIGDRTLEPDEGATVIGAESSRLERLVGDLLDSARMRKSAFTVRRETVDLDAVAQDVARRYEATARDAGLALNLKTQPGSIAVADGDRVLQVVSNLVENAIRCTPPPGTVTITTARGLVAVADTGRGLTGDDLPRAFERFYLYSRYGTDRPVGTGLGLAIVKELSEAMGGGVSVASAVGVGTAFTVALPRDDASPPAAPFPPSTVAPPPSQSPPARPRDDQSSMVALPRDDAS